MLNKIFLMGRLTRDPELKRTSNGTAVASFSLAVERQKKKDQEAVTDFIDCVAWRSTAEFVSKYFSKGRMAVVQGSLQMRDWTDRDGKKRRSAEVVVDDMYFGDSKKSDQSSNSYSGSYSGGNDFIGDFSATSGDFAELNDDDSDLPF